LFGNDNFIRAFEQKSALCCKFQRKFLRCR